MYRCISKNRRRDWRSEFRLCRSALTAKVSTWAGVLFCITKDRWWVLNYTSIADSKASWLSYAFGVVVIRLLIMSICGKESPPSERCAAKWMRVLANQPQKSSVCEKHLHTSSVTGRPPAIGPESTPKSPHSGPRM